MASFTNQVNTKLDRQHTRMLTDLCNYLGLDKSKAIRQAIKEKHERIFGTDPDKDQKVLE